MRTIHKYQLDFEEQTTIEMPRSAQPLTVQVQDDQICLWAMVDTSAELQPFTVQMVTTGAPANYSKGCYVGTVQMPRTGSVYHVFAWPGC